MSRSLVLGNGNMLICFDEFGQVRDFYFPYVGLENHAGRDLVHRIGVWADGNFSWLSDRSWKISIQYKDETMASDIVCENSTLELRVRFSDTVYNETNIFLRNATIENLSERNRHAKIFFNQEFRISENEHADTAYFNPTLEALIHYKGRRVILVGGELGGRHFDEYSVGLFGIEGREGAWKDAEDGSLSKNPIEHGAVDSVVGFSMSLASKAKVNLTYWICAGETYREVQALQNYILAKTAARLTKSTEDYWHAWVNKLHFTFRGLGEDVKHLFRISLLIMRAHTDNRGGILASGDSGNHQRYVRDTYGYVWPRDGAFAALAFDRVGHFDLSERFFAFCSDLITEEGYIMHKYQPDKSFGSSWHPWVKDGKPQLAIQEDETAILLFALWQHYKEAKDLEFVEKVYRSFVKLPASFLMQYREPMTGLPGPSYDLWEEKFGISTYTVASVYGALIAAGNFAELLGKSDEKSALEAEAAKIKAALLEHLYDKETGYFHKLITVENSKVEIDRTIDASSFFGVLTFGVLRPDDPIMMRAFEVLEKSASSVLPDRSGCTINGVVRYAGDKYFSENPASLGNPWFVTTLWALQYRITCAETEAELKQIASELSCIASYALQSGVLSEQIDPATGEQLSISPLVWSHAEFVTTAIEFMKKEESLDLGKMLE